LGERWTLLVVRELLSGTTQFNDIRRGIPRVSKTMLAERLRELRDAGVIVRHDGESGPSYSLTDAGKELATIVRDIGTWGQRWLPRTLPADELDGEALLWDVHRRVETEKLPARPLVVRIELTGSPGRTTNKFLLLKRTEVSLCAENPGFPVELQLTAPLRTMTAWWRGDVSFADARSAGLVLKGSRELVRAFPNWFARYAFAEVLPIRPRPGPDFVPNRASRGR
jgi:DNA-binding HxlR family transcriptional regulator